MTKKIVLIGCGNVGSRHLQALAKLPFPIEVDVVEPSKEAQSLGQSRLSEIEYEHASHNFQWHQSTEELKKDSDFVIVATTSIRRSKLLIDLLEKGYSKFLIEKMVCQSTNEYDLLLSRFKEYKARGWVNTNLRYFQAYQQVKNYFNEPKLLHLSLIASNVSALGTNLIHYVDLFSWLVNDYQVKLNGDLLLDKLFSNKRGDGLVEFAGTVTGAVRNGSSMKLTFIPDSNLPSIINIADTNRHLLIDETNQRISEMVNRNDLDFEYKYEHASSLTTKIATDILERDDCMLSSLENSYHLHKEIFRIFNLHIKKLTGKENVLCPIT